MTENFVLRSTPTSPFGRKVRMAIDALGLNNRITVTPADPLDEKDTLRQQNPLGKMPCLVLQDGSTIYDSGIIIEYSAGCGRHRQPAAAARAGTLSHAHAGTPRGRNHGRIGSCRLRDPFPPRSAAVAALARSPARQRFIVGFLHSRQHRPIRPRPTSFRSACPARSVILIGESRSTGARLILLWSTG